MSARMILAAFALAALLVGCENQEASCKAHGGHLEPVTVLVPVIVGKTTVMIPETHYECRGGS